MMRDYAATYLHLLQVGYQLREINFTSDASSLYSQILAFNGSRVMTYLYCEGFSSGSIGYKMQSGLIVPINPGTNITTFIATVSLHYSLPSFEIGCSNVVDGIVVKGFELVKE